MPLELKALIGVAALAALFWWHSGQLDEARQDGKNQCIAESVSRAQAREAQWQADAKTIDEVRAHERIQADSALAAALAGLRNRPSRSDIPTPSACPAVVGTGAFLYREDAEFLTRLAREADSVASDLRACGEWVKAVTKP